MVRTARETVEQHMAAIRDRDLEGIVSTYAFDAVLVDTTRIGRGIDHARAVHAEVLDAAAEMEPDLEVLAQDGVVFVSWRAAGPDGHALVGTNTFVVEDGLISVNTGFIAGGSPGAVGPLRDRSR